MIRMRFNKLDLNLLLVLDALLTEGSVKKAAEKVFLSPPATSNALARLREYFEDDLLQQVGKSMILTPKAVALQEPVRDVLLRIQAITTTIPVFDPKTCERRITIGASDYVMHVFLAEVLQHIWREAPLMKFDLRLVDAKSHAELDSGAVDLLITPEAFTAPGHSAEYLFNDDWSCVTWAGNDDLPCELTLNHYLSLGHVIVRWNDVRFTSYEERIIAQHGYMRRTEITAPGFAVLPQFLIGTHRIATLQTRLAHKLASQAALRVLPCPLPIPCVIEQLQWHKYHELDPAISWVRDVMREVAGCLSDASLLTDEN